MIWRYLIILFLIFITVSCKNILVAYSHDERSHIHSMAPFLKTLSAANHSIVVFETGDHDNELDLGPRVEVVYCQIPKNAAFWDAVDHMLWHGVQHSAMFAFSVFHLDGEVQTMFRLCPQQIQRVLSRDYDLLIIDEIFTVHGNIITQLLKKLKNVPHIMFSTSHVSPDWILQNLALGHNPVLNPIHGTRPPLSVDENFSPTKFLDRTVNFLEATVEVVGTDIANALVKSHQMFGLQEYDASNVLQGSMLHLHEMLDKLGRIIPISMEYRSIGSHCSESDQKLTKELTEFVEDEKSNGTIYIAFGSLVNFKMCPEHVFNAFFDALNEFENYRIIFVLRNPGKKLPNMKRHIKIISWAPQHAILNHPKTKLFISHGGLKSFKESICAGKPMIIFPLFAEQVVTAFTVLKYRSGGVLNKFSVTKNAVVEEINRILNDPSFEQKSKKFKQFYLDRPMDSLDEAKFLIDRIFRKAEQKVEKRSVFGEKRKGISLNWTQYLNLDWFLMLIFVSWTCFK